MPHTVDVGVMKDAVNSSPFFRCCVAWTKFLLISHFLKSSVVWSSYTDLRAWLDSLAFNPAQIFVCNYSDSACSAETGGCVLSFRSVCCDWLLLGQRIWCKKVTVAAAQACCSLHHSFLWHLYHCKCTCTMVLLFACLSPCLFIPPPPPFFGFFFGSLFFSSASDSPPPSPPCIQCVDCVFSCTFFRTCMSFPLSDCFSSYVLFPF